MKKKTKKVQLKNALSARVDGVTFKKDEQYTCTTQPFGGYMVEGAYLTNIEFESLFEDVNKINLVK